MIYGVVVALSIIFRKHIGKLGIVKKVRKVLTGFSEGLRTVFKLKRPLLFIFYMLFTWLMYYLMVYFTFFAFEPTENLSAIAGLVIFVFAAFGIGAPSPGGMGAYQFLVMTALATFYSIDKVDAFTFSNIAFFAPYISNLVFGVIAMILLPFFKKRKSLI